MEAQQRVALVTGAGTGLGAAIAVKLGELGFDLAVHYHSSEESAVAVCEQIHSMHRNAVALQADLGQEDEAERLSRDFDAEFPRLDVLVNNAGVYLAKPFLESSEKDWFAELNSTATATYLTTRALIPQLRKTEGRIINVGDGSCDRIGAREASPAYHIGKSGVWLLTRSFAKEEAKNRVAVNMISPGLLENSVGLDQEMPVPAKRYGSFDDVFPAIEFLATKSTSYLSGSNIVVGGGWNL